MLKSIAPATTRSYTLKYSLSQDRFASKTVFNFRLIFGLEKNKIAFKGYLRHNLCSPDRQTKISIWLCDLYS